MLKGIFTHRNKMNKITIQGEDLPSEIYGEAQTLSAFFEKQGMRYWKLYDVTDRRLVMVVWKQVSAAVDLHNQSSGLQSA
jgi:hypothetical protein